ncbi:MAG: agmatinase [Syntrophorhabdaceae bacterium]
MRTGTFHNQFIGSRTDETQPEIILLGCPLDVTSSFRGGSKFGPESLRRASWTLETYSPYLDCDLEDICFADKGDLELPQGNLLESIAIIEEAAGSIVEDGKKPLFFGGEHLVTYPILRAFRKYHSILQVVHFDAHADLRDDYEGQKLSHASAMKRVTELGSIRLHQIGIRSGTRQEFKELRPVRSPEDLSSRLDAAIPVYISFDMDVFDPSLAPGVTTPEPGGLMFKEVIEYLDVLKGRNIIGADLVELAPDYDITFVSSVCAAKIAREIIMLLDPHTK